MYKIKIIYGEAASRYAVDYGEKKAIAKIKKGTLDGMVRTYDFDTEHDLKLLDQALGDFDGWMGWYVCDDASDEK